MVKYQIIIKKTTMKLYSKANSPYENILGTADNIVWKDWRRNVDGLKGERFGEYLGGGSEQIVFQDTQNPNQVLKIQADIGVKKPVNARNFPSLMNMRLRDRNQVPFQLHAKLEGFIKIGNKYYPVHKQKYIRPLPAMSSSLFESSIRPRITYSLQEHGFKLNPDGRYTNGTLFLEDIKPENIGIDTDDHLRFFNVQAYRD